MRTASWVCLASAAAAVVLGVGAASASCAQTPTTVPVRTFELAQRMDVVCMQVNDQNGNTLPNAPIPVQEENCANVASGVNGAALQYHLYAVVTQLARGELAVVDLTAGNVVDEDRTTPGIQFIPVGINPTDVTVMSPEPEMTFVSSGDPLKPAIYGIPNVRLLGDSLTMPAGVASTAPLQLTDLYACALPQPPMALSTTQLANGQYVLVATLRPSAGQTAKVVTIDPSPMIVGAGVQGDAAVDTDAGVAPGSLTPCVVLGATELNPNPPATWTPGPSWPDGVPYVDGGVSLGDAEPTTGATCAVTVGAYAADGGLPVPLTPSSQSRPRSAALRDDANAHVLYVADEGLPVIHVVDVSDPTNPREGQPLLATSMFEPARQVSVGAIALSPPTRDYKRYLYAVDTTGGTVMVYDVTDPVSSPHQPLQRPHPELNPFVAPDRLAFSAPVATLAFVRHDWPLPSQLQGSSPINNYEGLLCNPNPNALTCSGPSCTPTFNDYGAYYRPDQAGTIEANSTVQNFPDRLRGVFAFVTLSNGSIVVIDVDDWDAPCRRPDPMALTSAANCANADGGAQCDVAFGMTGSLDQPEPPPASASDLEPYHAPQTFNSNVPSDEATSIEAFYPVSAPNRMRSNYLLRNDPSAGDNVPNLIAPVLLFDLNGAPLAISGGAGLANPLLLPTPLPANFVDPMYFQNPTNPDPTGRDPVSAALANAKYQTPDVLLPGSTTTAAAAMRISWDDPTVHQNQDWAVTYEGALPTVQGLAADIASYDGYRTLTLAASYLGTGVSDAGADGAPSVPDAAAQAGPSPAFCERGIEDWSLGQERATAVLAALKAAGLPAPAAGANGGYVLPQYTADYVELTDDLLPNTDPYWTIPSSENDCWNDSFDGQWADPPGATSTTHDQDRYNACYTAYNSISNGDTQYGRDFPILEAYDDHLVLGRYGWLPYDASGNSVSEQPNNRVVVGPDDSNKPFLEAARCCFHHEATFKVRTGGEWVTVGSTTGYLHHIVADPTTNRCVPSCNQIASLLNARAFDVPWSTAPKCVPPATMPAGIDRDSVLAMRNPMFSFVIWQGCAALQSNDLTETQRDMQWRFSLRGGFTPLTLSLTGGTTTAVSPQSMRFIDSLGQLAIVDGSQQGLVLFDLNSLAFAHNPYF